MYASVAFFPAKSPQNILIILNRVTSRRHRRASAPSAPGRLNKSSFALPVTPTVPLLPFSHCGHSFSFFATFLIEYHIYRDIHMFVGTGSQGGSNQNVLATAPATTKPSEPQRPPPSALNSALPSANVPSNNSGNLVLSFSCQSLSIFPLIRL